jgi:PAS domain S-box-containing protein
MDTGEIFIDPNLKALLGYKDDDIPNHMDYWGKLVHQDDIPAMEKAIRDHVEGRMPQFEFEHRMTHKDGTTRWILARGNILNDTVDRPRRMIGTDTDITELKRTQMALRESEERFRHLSDAAEEGIAIHDKGLIIDANDALARMFGHSLSHLVGMHAEKLTTQESWKIMQEHMEAGYDRPYEVTGVRKDGSTFALQTVGKTYRYRGKTLRVAIFRDITDLKHAEALLRKTADELRAERKVLEEKNVALKQILQHIENERKDYQQRICQDIRQAITPFVSRLRQESPAESQNRLEALELRINTLLSKDIDAFRSRYERLSPRELEICEMIRKGLSSKQISESLTLSLVTVHKHREQIRRKLGLTGKKINLATYLQAH